MDPRQFDDLIRDFATKRGRLTRRHLLAAVPFVAAVAVAPRVSRAFDAGIPLTPVAPGQIVCTGAIDCPSGLICLNGICASLPGGSTSGSSSAVGGSSATVNTAGPTPTPRTISRGQTATEQAGAGTPVATTPEPTPITADATGEPTTTPTPGAVGGEAAGTTPLTVGIFAGRCGALAGDPVYPLIDIGAGSSNGAAATPPAGAPEDATGDFSATVLNTTLESLLETGYAIDLRTNPQDPGSSVACGDLGGTIDTTTDPPELVNTLDEQNASGVTGVSWLRGEGDRTLAYVFANLPEDSSTASASPLAGTPSANAFAAGDTLATLGDVNLRVAPSTEAGVVEVIATGATLEATGAETDGWVPVREPGAGLEGFVAAEFLEQQN